MFRYLLIHLSTLSSWFSNSIREFDGQKVLLEEYCKYFEMKSSCSSIGVEGLITGTYSISKVIDHVTIDEILILQIFKDWKLFWITQGRDTLAVIFSNDIPSLAWRG